MSKYLAAFQSLTSGPLADDFVLQGDRLLVEEIKPEEMKTQSGIVLASDTGGFGRNKDGLDSNRAFFARVLVAGPGHYEEDGTDVPCEVAPGDVVMVSLNSVMWFTTFMNNIATVDVKMGLTRESDVHLHFKGRHAYDEVRAFLKSQLEPKV